MPFTQIGDINIYHERSGTGPKLLYISGTGGDLRRPGSIFSTPLAEQFDVLSYDQRGLGQTDKPDAPYSMAQYAEDAAGLLDAVGWERCSVHGTSFGGMVAQELALRHPDRVEKLVLCCTAGGGAGGASYPLHELDGMEMEEKLRFRLGINDKRLDAAWQAANPDEVEKMIAEQIAQQSLGADEPGRAVGARRQLEARAGHDTWDRLPQLSMPVLVCGGKYDGQAEPAVVEALAGRIPGAQLKWFEGGHGFQAQDPMAYVAIAEFLNS
ncbi:MAG: alpha/beta fold hydrolase [Proteobacteria bacterium]|nr:alpha/beta fold hydrolase [Pseudomonadota bacterium]